MSLSDPRDNLGSIFCHSEPSKVHYFTKKETGGALFLEAQYSDWALKYHQIHTLTSLIKGHARFSRKKSSLPSYFHVID